MQNKWILVLLPLICLKATAGFVDMEFVKSPTIKTVKLFPAGNQLAYPIINLGAVEALELHFDDMASYSKSLSYTYQLCDADWTPVDLSQFDYIKGFSQNRITVYRPASVSLTRYIHYTANLPAANCMPSRSGNYLLKIFENGDTSNLLFTKKMLVVDSKAGVAAQAIEPFASNGFRTHQRIVVNMNTQNIDIYNANQQLKVVVLQNNRWDNAQMATSPTFIRSKSFEYNTEGLFDFEGGKEFRWLDLRSFRLQSERVRKGDYTDAGTQLTVAPDTARPALTYYYYKDYDGGYFIEMYENYNPWWQSDYAKVHFTFLPPERQPFDHKDLYLIGELTNFKTDENSLMKFNVDKGCYEKTLFLKNGYYNYTYQTIDQNIKGSQPSFESTEGNSWETENSYTVLVYYKGFGGRADELIGTAFVNSVGALTQPR